MKAVREKNKKQSFLEGAMVLMVATALVKVLGAIFKIPLGNLISEYASGCFQNAYDLYLPIYSIALAGMPVAVCRMVASFVASGKYSDARTVLKVAQKTFLVIGIIGTLLVLAFAVPYLKISGNGLEKLPVIITIAPSILFFCIMSTYRGYYEGLCNMTPTAISQVIESIGKVIIGLALVVVAKQLGMSEVYQAAAAILGIMLGTLFGAIYLKLRFVKSIIKSRYCQISFRLMSYQ